MGSVINEFFTTILFIEMFYCLFLKNEIMERKKTRVLCAVVIFCYLCCYCFKLESLREWIGLGIDLCLVLILLNEKLIYKLFAFILCYSLTGIFDIVNSWLISKVLGITLLDAMGNSSVVILGNIVSILLWLIFLVVTHRKNYIMVISLWNCILLAIECSMSGVIVFCFAHYQMNERMRIALEYTTIFTSILSIGICVLLIWINSTKKKIESEKNMQEAYMELQQTYYRQIQENERETRKLYHDMKQHLDMIYVLEKNEQHKEVEDYLNVPFEKISNARGGIPNIGNEVISAILMQKISEAKEYGISLHYKGKIINSISIEPFDLVTVVGNLLQNSIEYCDRMGFDKISFEVGNFRGNLYISVSNPIKEDTTLEKMLKTTNKQNKRMHGLGLHNVLDVVEKYNGEISVECNDNILQIRIVLLNEK